MLTWLPAEELLELLDGEDLHEVVLGIEDDRDAVVADDEAGPLESLLLGLRLLLGLGRAGGIDDVHLALQVAAETAAGAVIADEDLHVRAEFLGVIDLRDMGDAVDGAGAVQVHLARELGSARRAATRRRGGVTAIGAAPGQ